MAKGFRSGIEFLEDNCTPKSLEKAKLEDFKKRGNRENDVNILNIIENEICALSISKTKNEQLNTKLEVTKKNINVEVPNIDKDIEPFQQSKIPILRISEAPKTNMKTEWAEQININVPVSDFDKKIPDPAMTFPYELDTFQKQAILKLEEQKDVFVAAHTSAGKTTIAEYAIAMSQKHLTR